MRALIILLFSTCAQAQSCLPMQDTAEWSGSALSVGASRNGAWVRWMCLPKTPDETHQPTIVTYVGTLAELSKVGARVQTILKAADPLKSLQTAGQRFPILPLTDPSLAAIVADVK